MVDVKRLIGVMDTDSRETDVLPIHHIDSKNMRWYGGANGLSGQNVKGNYVIPNSNLPAGTNECIGGFYDSVKRRIIWFNYNSNGNHGIYQVVIQTGAVSQIFRCGVNSATDILNFSLDYPVHSASIVYRTEGDGDLLYWTDGYNRPRYLNLDTVSALSPFIENMINAGKDAPLITLTAVYRDNTSLIVNNLSKKLFRFAFRQTYDNLEKSTFSPLTAVPMPINGFDQAVISNPTKNNTIRLNGVARLDNSVLGDITGVEIVGQESLGDIWSDYFLITTIPSSDFGVTQDFQFDFINDSVYTTIPVDESDLYFSWLPDKANTLEVLNGNVIIYGGITDGYPNLQESECDVVVYSGLGEGEDALVLNIIQTSDGVLTGIIGGNADSNTTISTQFEYDNGIQYQIQASITPAAMSTLEFITTSFVAALNAEFVTEGISGEVTAVQVGTGNTFTITTTNPAGVYRDIELLNDSSFTVPYPNEVLKWGSQYRYGLVYFDERGKTNGVISFVNTTPLNNFGYVAPDFATMPPPPGNQLVPYMMATINHLPPTWAKRFQWVRTANQTTNSYIQLVTNDYQTDTDYLYFCIQNLTYLKTKNTGFNPSYDFKEGDRLKVIASYNTSNGVRTIYGGGSLFDYEVLGTVERTMTSPATAGRFIKVKKPASGLPSYTANSFIELYSPLARTTDAQQVFYEFGETFEINANDPSTPNVLYHGGNMQEQLANTPAAFLFYIGDSYFKPRIFYLDVDATTTKTTTVMDTGYSDYFISKVNSDGRGWIINPEARTEYNSVLVRWGGKYQSGTNVNNLPIFRPADFDEVIRSYGDIRRFKVREKILRVFQDRGVGQYGVYARFIQNNQGQPELVTTNEIITTNNVNYYQGTYGLGGYATNLCSTPVADYFNDVVTGREIRLSGDGLTDLGLLYKGQFYLPSLVTPYNKTLLRANGSIAKVMKFWDSYENEAHTFLQAGTANGTTTEARHYSFNELRNGFCSYYDYHPEWALSAEDMIYSFKEGQIYKHDVSGSNYCNFYGVQYNAYVTPVFNPSIGQKKSWQSVAEVASTTWECPLIYTDTQAYAGQRQESNLVAAEFRLLEGMPSTSFKRDVKSRGGKINGDFLKGNYLVAKFQVTNASDLVTLSEILVRYIDSPLNVR